jgi:hypothetical protein
MSQQLVFKNNSDKTDFIITYIMRSFIQISFFEVNSTCILNSWGSSVWIVIQQTNY